MKRSMIPLIGILFSLVACNGSSSTEKGTANVQDTVATSDTALKVKIDQDLIEGSNLIAKQDCGGCHSPYDKLVGPSYKNVAARYQHVGGEVTYLSDKIIQGGKGAWGEIPMPPHPGLNKQNTEKIVKYILSVK